MGSSPGRPSRRVVLRAGVLGAAAAVSAGSAGATAPPAAASVAGTSDERAVAGLAMPTTRRIDLNQGWLFGGRFADGAQDPGYDDSGFTPVTLPHTVVPLSWGNWDPASWQDVWIYRRHFRSPGGGGGRVFADFD